MCEFSPIGTLSVDQILYLSFIEELYVKKIQTHNKIVSRDQ